jgi:hypothetical protein
VEVVPVLGHTILTNAKIAGTYSRGRAALQEAGGWSSLAMPRRYVEESEIANEGMT